jgi:hypothetical protein
VKKIDQLMSTFEPPDDAKDDRRRPAAYSTKYTGTDRKILRPMATLHNEITIDAPIEKIWTSLSNNRVKFGLLGKVLDWLMIRKQSDAGVKKFMAGLKSYAEAK